MATNQRQAVFMATLAVLSSANVEFVPGTTVIHDVMTKELKNQIVDSVCSMFLKGEVTFKESESNDAKLADPKELKKYVSGLVTNWHNKDKALNAGAKYETKNPGSRAGSQDEQIKEMKNLQKVLEAAGNTEGAAQVAQAITARLELLKAESTAKSLPKVDISKLPEHLRSLIEEEV